MSSVFISYARYDKAFSRWLHAALEAQDYDVWVDWEDIHPSAEFKQEIYAGIEAAEAYLFVISPDSLRSQVCAQELAHAQENNKRLIPLVYREVPSEDVPKPLADLNWIFFREGDDFTQSLKDLVKSIETDLDWVRLHTRLQVRAIEWENKDRGSSYLLRGEDLKEAETWRQDALSKDPQPTPLQDDYIRQSREAENRRKE